MINSPKLNDVFKEISTKAIEYGNTPDNQQKYMHRLVHVFKEVLTEEEQVFFVWYIFNNMHYKSLLIDPETMMAANNIKLKSILFVATAVLILMIVFSIAFDKGSFFGKIYKQIADMVLMLVA